MRTTANCVCQGAALGVEELASGVVSVVKAIRHKRASWLILEGSPTAAGRWKMGCDQQEQPSSLSHSLGKDTVWLWKQRWVCLKDKPLQDQWDLQTGQIWIRENSSKLVFWSLGGHVVGEFLFKSWIQKRGLGQVWRRIFSGFCSSSTAQQKHSV